MAFNNPSIDSHHDDQSTDTIQTNLSSDHYLARIQKETNRLKRKKKEHKNQSFSSQENSFVEESSLPSHTVTTDGVQNISLVDSSFDSLSSPLRSSNNSSTPSKDLRLPAYSTSPPHLEKHLNDQAEQQSDTENSDLVLQRGDSYDQQNDFGDSDLFATTSDQSATESHKRTSSLWSFLSLTKTNTMETYDSQKEREAFRNKLIDEVLGKESGEKVPMEKVMMIIWQFREDKEVLKFMTRFVSKFAGSRDVFEGIEFYLPQLAHMIIHLETEWDDAILERFSLVIAQQSIHFALQLNWILAGAIEDYQPELPDGNPNPTYNPLYYFRCVKLLTNIERCVVYRRPRSQELQRLYEKGKITKAEMHSLEQADRRFTAMQITAPEDEATENFGGRLLYKRAIRTSCFKFKRWKTRYFAIEERMLNCYNTEGGTLIRSMPLEGATVEPMKQTKYKNMFRVNNRSFEFRIRAASPEDRIKWIAMLENEAKSGRVFGHADGSQLLEKNEDAQRVIDELTPSQRDRYIFYRQERDFVRKLTDIAEDLRFLEPPDRKKAAPGLLKELEIPSSVYSPLMSSTDIFRRIHSAIYKDTRVFNTKERCPTVMYFLGVRGELEYKGERHANMDIAEYIHLKFNANLEDGQAKMKTSIGEDGKELIEVELDTHKKLSSDGKETLVVKKIVPTISEGDETKNSSDDLTRFDTAASKDNEDEDDPFLSPRKGGSIEDKASVVWSGSFTDNPGEATPVKRPSMNKGSPVRANRHLKRFLRESMVSMPRKLAHHLERKQRHSKNDGSSRSLVDVPIATGRRSAQNHGLGENLYVGQSSVMDQNNTILKGKSKAGDIDQDSMQRAKEIICGGQTWAEKSFGMLEDIKNKPEDQKVQLEIVCLMSKSNDDLRQEVFVMQMIHYYKSVFIAAGLPLWLKTYKILSTSASTGLLEFNQDATSLDGLKKSEKYPAEGGLRKYFEDVYGGPDSRSFKAAQRNFMQSVAAYSVVCYLLGLKDRHNGNIMIDMYGHLIHIDYGFCMGMCVGHEFTLERAPFKLTEEYVEVMGGVDSDCYKEFVRLFVEGMKEARDKCHIALGLVEIMMFRSNYPCFSGRRYGGGQALRGFRERLMLDVPDEKVERKCKALIEEARDHLGTWAYDSFQQWSNGYAM